LIINSLKNHLTIITNHLEIINSTTLSQYRGCLYICPINHNKLIFNKKNSLEMKQIFSILAILVLGAFAVSAQSGPVMTFESTTIDYGTIEKNAEPNRIFKFTNTGDAPLIIKSSKGSCGCTVPESPTEPIMPGESNVIKVRYATDRIGAFTKTVTLETNETVTSRVLTIKGEVKAPAVEETVPASTGGIKQ
jgi:hypothetical protein